ncbi:hypothetical protein A4A49_40484 [Nicotiana attenuata]|uniref:Uncharacterized protein n=1 Tax=Nicotiana attenuata TaxID=49451 RepID=A0A1J6KBQ4_NICAT|nr:hypothetical protein A4A49_40484 [Nicotiana attenuata]
MEELWQKMVLPVRRAWFVVSARVKARKNGAGLLKLHGDIQSCGYADVQVMWEMLGGTRSELRSRHIKQKHHVSFRNFVLSNHSAKSASFSTDHAH